MPFSCPFFEGVQQQSSNPFIPLAFDNAQAVHISLAGRREDWGQLPEFTQKEAYDFPVALSDEARQRLLQYPWPGNIRELENFVSGLAVRGAALDDQGVWTLLDRPGPILDLILAGERTLAEVEAEYTAYLLRKYRNKSRVARILGISRKSLYNKLKRHDEH